MTALWLDEVLCGPGRGVNPDWWSVDMAMSPQNVMAQQICGRCPVALECWRDNLGVARNQIIAGVWINADGRPSKQAGQPHAPTRWRQPCGTPAGAFRHRYHGEDLCDACREAEQARDRLRKPHQRAAFGGMRGKG